MAGAVMNHAASNTAYAVYGLVLPPLLGYRLGSLGVWSDWRFYVLTLLAVQLGVVCRWEARRA